MAFKHKFTYEEKVKIVSEYIDGTYGFREICKRYDINQGSLKDWKRLYETFGWSGLKTASKTTRYSKETKEAAVRDYLSHEFTFPEILKKYQIRSGTQLKKWIKKYNGCEVLKSSGTGGNNIMTTGRKTTFHHKLEQAGMTQSMSRVAHCTDNGPMEGFWGILKREMYYKKKFHSREELVSAIVEYIDYYRNDRPQRGLGILTPMEYHDMLMAA